MEYYEYDGKLCVSMDMLVRDDRTSRDQSVRLAPILTRASYDKMVNRGTLVLLRQGKGKGNCALIELSSLPEDLYRRVVDRYGDAESQALCNIWERHYEYSADARAFYSDFRFADGEMIPRDHVHGYTINASVLEAVARLRDNTLALRKLMGTNRLSWSELQGAIAYYQQKYHHSLPLSPTRFSARLKAYLGQDGVRHYETLISGKFGNQNTRKVSYPLERILLSIAGKPTKPSYKEVWELYQGWIVGSTIVTDYKTGEIHEPEHFLATHPKAGDLSLATVYGYLKKPKNQTLLRYLHESSWDFNQGERPHHMRHSPHFALSKISLDDRDLPRPMTDGKRVKAYYAVDVASGAIIGYAHSKTKKADLFIACMLNMFRLIDRQGWGVPAQIEVEHHLVRDFADGLVKAGEIFSFVRWCNPGNSQEKRAEHTNRAKKYTIEKRKHQNIGRFYARLESNRTKHQKVYDEHNDTYIERRYDYKTLVADDIEDIQDYNSQLHPNQEKYPQMTRWDVLCAEQNPRLAPLDKALLATYIGEHRTTTIRRNMYITACYDRYRLPSVDTIDQLASRNRKVDAYWIPTEDGTSPEEVYIYQEGRYLGVCRRIEAYNEATAEQTQADKDLYEEQASYVAQFDAKMRREKIERVHISTPKSEARISELVERASRQAEERVQPSSKEEEDISPWLDVEQIRQSARQRL